MIVINIYDTVITYKSNKFIGTNLTYTYDKGIIFFEF